MYDATRAVATGNPYQAPVLASTARDITEAVLETLADRGYLAPLADQPKARTRDCENDGTHGEHEWTEDDIDGAHVTERDRELDPPRPVTTDPGERVVIHYDGERLARALGDAVDQNARNRVLYRRSG
ncbi:hypothetical protein [Cryptosporangium aurantiacum]|uniref:Uncharacterized protein n=1 Tax=Cryptosporangium aurantiacum TaxID=134849 RepID=A0A1M7PT07_9ACTN|nr:hypothetical protein [Cryptosporangium aurantiacum]SHN20606.1 hypothetical protein SAMN05443668_103655 [Cryptosporangium aurantiacum]